VKPVAFLLLATLASLAGTARADTPAPLRIVALGDSLTAGLGLPTADAFPARLEAALKAKGENVEVVDAGVSGDTASDGLARLDWAFGDHVDGVIVELGANDMLRGVDPQHTRSVLDQIVGAAEARGAQVLVAGMLAAPNLGSDYAKAFNAIFPDIAESHGALLYPFFMDGLIGVPGMVQADGEHPTAQGSAEIVKRMLPSVEQLIDRIKKDG